MSRLLEIEAFVAVAERGSFVAAATQQGVSAGYVSKLVSLAAIFHRFSCAHPEVHLSVHYLDRVVDLIGERFDLAVRAGELPDSSLHARRVGTYRKQLVAAPAVAAALAPLTHPEQLRGARGVVYSGHPRPGEWSLSRDGQRALITVHGRTTSNNGRALALAAASGLGVGYLPEFHTCDLVAAGRLQQLLPGWGGDIPVHVVFPSRRHLPLRVRALIDAVVAELAGSCGAEAAQGAGGPKVQ